MKKKLLALLMGMALVLVLAACGGGDDEASGTADSSGEKDAGEQLFADKNCFACHGKNLEGTGSNPNLQKVGASLSQDEIKVVIMNGRGQMPKQNVTDEEATTLAEWLAAKK